MQNQAQFQERQQLFRQAFQMEEKSRIPMMSNFFTWKILDSDEHYKISEATTNYEIMEHVVRQFHERYQFDAYQELGTRNQTRVSDALGGGYHIIDDEKESVFVKDKALMEGNEYPEYQKDPLAFTWTKSVPRFNPDLTYGQIKQAVRERIAFGEYSKHMEDVFLNEYNCLLYPRDYDFVEPYEIFFNIYRGIKGMSIDIRRNKKQLMAAMDTMYDEMMQPMVDACIAEKRDVFFADAMFSLLGTNILSAKQFEEIYWPQMQKTCYDLFNAGKKIYFFVEGEMKQFVPFFRDMPKGQVMIHLENDDIFEIRKLLPNASLCGGMQPSLLAGGTKEECVEYVKRLVGEIGPGFVLSQSKMISFRNDCNRENMLAVSEYAHTHKG